MGLTTTEQTSIESAFLTKVKAAIPVHSSNTDHDTELTDLTLSAIGLLERACKRQFKTRSVVWTLDEFPETNYIEVPLPKLSNLTSIQYYDVSNTQQTWLSSKYEVDTASEPGRVGPISSESWPSTYDRLNAVTVTYDSGYGSDETSFPNGIQQAIKLTVKAWFEETTDKGEIPDGAMTIVDGYHSGRFSQLLKV